MSEALKSKTETESSAPHANPWKDPSILGAMSEFGKALKGISDAALGKEDHGEEDATGKHGHKGAPDLKAVEGGKDAAAEGGHGRGHAKAGGSKKPWYKRIIPGDKGDLWAALESISELNHKRKEGNLSQHDVEHAWDHFADLADWDLFRLPFAKKGVARLAGWMFGIPEHPVTPTSPQWDNLGGQVLSFVDHPTHHFHHDVENLCRGFGNGFALTSHFRRLSNPATFRHSMGSPAGRDAIKKEASSLFNLDADLTREEVEQMTTTIMARWGADIHENPAGSGVYVVHHRHHAPRNRQDNANHMQFAQIYANALTLLTASNLDKLYPRDKVKVDIKYDAFGASIDTQVQSGTSRETFLENFNADAFRATFAQLLNPVRLQNDLATEEGRAEVKTLLKSLFNLKPTTKLAPGTLPIEIYEILRTHTPGTPGTVLDLGGIAPGTTSSKLGARTAYMGEALAHFDQLNDMLVAIFNNLDVAPTPATGVPTPLAGGTYGTSVEALYHSKPKVMDLGLGKMPKFGEIVLSLEKAEQQDEFLRAYKSSDFKLYFDPLLDRPGIQKACTDPAKRAGLKAMLASLVGSDTVNNGARLKSFVDHFDTKFNSTRFTIGSTEAKAHAAMVKDLNDILNALFESTAVPPLDLVATIVSGPEKKSLYENMFGKMLAANTIQEISELLGEYDPALMKPKFPILSKTGKAKLPTDSATKTAAREECNRLFNLTKVPTFLEVEAYIESMITKVDGWLASDPIKRNGLLEDKAKALKTALENIQDCVKDSDNYNAIFLP